MLTVDDDKLVHSKPVVLLRMIKIDQCGFACGQYAVVGVILDIHAFGQQFVEAAVFFEE